MLHWAGDQPRAVARACRHFGISRKAFYKWKKRFEAHGAAGLVRSPTHAASVAARHRSRGRQQDPLSAGAVPLRRGPHRRLSEALSPESRSPLVRPPHSRQARDESAPRQSKASPPQERWQRYEKPQPGHRLQVDVKFLERIPGTRKRLYQFTAIDDCTRIRVLKVYDACNQRTAIRFIDEVVRRLPFRVHVVQTDNGAEFQSHFHWHLEAWTSATSTSARGRRTSMAKSSAHTASTTKSFTSCSIATASRTTFTCSTRSCANGRTTTITTDRTARSMAKRRTNDSWQKLAGVSPTS